MSPDKVVVRSNGLGLPGLLGTVFVVLKLTGYINWPWIWVLAPFWLPIAIGLAILLLIGILAILVKK